MEAQDTAQTAPSQTATKSEPEEEKCCHVCSIKTGSIVVAVFWSVISLMLLIVGITQAPRVADYHSRLEEYNTFFNRIHGILVTCAIVGVFGLVTSLSLLFGIIKSSPRFMFPWLISSGIITLVVLVLNIVLIVALYGINGYSGAGGGTIIGAGTNCGLMIYSIVIVLNHYLNIQIGVGTANVAYEPAPV